MDYEQRIELLNALHNAKDYFDLRIEQYDKIINNENELVKKKSQLEFAKKNNFLPSIVVVFLFFIMNTFNIMVLIMLEQSEQIIDSLSSVMIYALVGGILIIIFLSVINNILTKSEIKNLTKQLGKIEIARMQTSHELYDYYNAFSDKSLLPFKYSYPGSIEILWDIINDYRANSITDAINLFIEDSHRNKMENIQAGILKENKKLNQTASSAKNWAVASTAVSVLGLLKRD